MLFHLLAVMTPLCASLPPPPIELTSGGSLWRASSDVCSHWLIGIDSYHNTIELEDSSLWSVVFHDRWQLSTWRRNDPIVLTSNPYWFDRGEYFLTNQRNQSSVSANLYDAPLLFGNKSHWVISVDPISGHFMLEDGSMWCVHDADLFDLFHWHIDDHIIFGVFNTPYCSCDHVIINAELGTQVRGHRY